MMKGSHTGVKASSSICPRVSFSLLVSFSSRAVSHTTWYHWSMLIPDRSLQCLVMMFLAAESRWVMSSLWCKWALLSWKMFSKTNSGVNS